MKTKEGSLLELIIPAFIATVLIMGFIAFSSGKSLIVTFVPAMILSYIAYVLTTYRKMPAPKRVVPVYFLAIGVQLLHFSEEFIGRFYEKFPRLIDGSPGYSQDLFVGFNMWAYFVFILAGLALYKGLKIPSIIAWFFVIMGTIGNAIVHLVFCFLEGGYFPGFYTSLIYWVLGPILLLRMIGR